MDALIKYFLLELKSSTVPQFPFLFTDCAGYIHLSRQFRRRVASFSIVRGTSLNENVGAGRNIPTPLVVLTFELNIYTPSRMVRFKTVNL